MINEPLQITKTSQKWIFIFVVVCTYQMPSKFTELSAHLSLNSQTKDADHAHKCKIGWVKDKQLELGKFMVLQ